MCKLLSWLCGDKSQLVPEAPKQLPYGFKPKDVIVSRNVSLSAPYEHSYVDGTLRVVPDHWQLHSYALCADNVPDQYSDHARILPNAIGLTFLPHNEEIGIDGKWGFSQTIDLQPGCYLLKVTGRNWINDPKQGNILNYIISGWIDGALLSKQMIPHQSAFEFIYPFPVDVAGSHDVKWLVEVLWATPGHNSKIDIYGAGVLSVDSGHCNKTE